MFRLWVILMFGESVRVLVCTLIPVAACMVAGAAVRRDRSDWPGSDMLAGFGLLTGALAGLAIVTRIPLSWLMAGLVIVSVAALAVRRRFPGGRSTWIALALVSPIAVSAAGHDPAMWDDFW